MSKKLLHKTLRVYVLYSITVLLLSAPVFYFFTNRLFINEADETLLLHQKEFNTNNLPFLHTEDLALWNKVSRDVKIEKPDLLLKKDSVFDHFYYDSLAEENEPYRVLKSPISIDGKPYVFMARFNLVETEDLVMSIAGMFCAVLALLLTGLYFITRRLSFRLWLPFYSTLHQIERFQLDKNSNPDFAETHVEEFTRLNQSINRLLEKNLQIYKDQKEFIENAAHELQTPLAEFQAKLDVLVQQVPFTQELGDTLSKLNEAVSGLNRINKNLLLLSKIENNQYASFQQVSVNEILKKQVAFLTEQAEDKNVTVTISRLDSLTLNVSPTLLEIAISNLLLNALRHNKVNGKIDIELDQKMLSISNSSPQPAIQPEKLFQRFSSAGPDRGNGLGLSIVKKICDLHGWQVVYQYADERHIFQIKF